MFHLWSKQFNSPHEDVRMDWLVYLDRFQWENERDFRFVTKIDLYHSTFGHSPGSSYLPFLFQWTPFGNTTSLSFRLYPLSIPQFQKQSRYLKNLATFLEGATPTFHKKVQS